MREKTKKAEKKTLKSKDELNREIEVQQRQKFIDAIANVEKTHGYTLIGMMDYTQFGIRPTVGLKKNDPEEKKVD